MQTTFLIAAALLYIVCAVLPPRRAGWISAATAAAWLLHGASLWLAVSAPGSLRIGFAAMLSSALWISVGAYWLENRNFALDGLRRIVMPNAALAVLLQAAFPGALVALDGNTRMLGWHIAVATLAYSCLLYTSPSPRDRTRSRMPSSA